MSVASWILWAFVATTVLTTTMAVSQGIGLTRMNLPFLLGTMVTGRSDRATVLGFLLHLVNGWLFALLYVAAFEAWNAATWWLGAAIGLVHATFVLAAAMPLLPYLHPRMAREDDGPIGPERATTGRTRLEPPGFLALHYGARTPMSVTLAHVVYGALLGAFYVVS